MAARKNVSTEKLLGKLTPQQRKEFAAQYNTGLGSGKSPEEYQKSIAADKPAAKKTAAKKKK